MNFTYKDLAIRQANRTLLNSSSILVSRDFPLESSSPQFSDSKARPAIFLTLQAV
jgi:hypothetical protein